MRSRRSGDWVIDLMHYLGTFLRKPAALGRSVALQQVHPSVAALYREHFRELPRDFIELLVYARDNNLAYTDIVCAAASLAARGYSAYPPNRYRPRCFRLKVPYRLLPMSPQRTSPTLCRLR